MNKNRILIVIIFLMVLIVMSGVVIGDNINVQDGSGSINVRTATGIKGYGLNQQLNDKDLKQITVNEVTIGGTNIKTEYEITGEKTQTKTFTSSTIGDNLVVTDEQAFNSIKQAISGIPKEKIGRVTISLNSLTVMDDTNTVPTFKATVSTDKTTTSIKTGFIGPGATNTHEPYFNTKVEYSGGTVTTTTNVPKIYDKDDKQIDIYAYNKLTLEDKQETQIVSVLKSYTGKVYFVDSRTNKRDEKKQTGSIEATVISTKHTKEGEIPDYTYEIRTEVVTITVDGTGKPVKDSSGKYTVEKKYYYSESGTPLQIDADGKAIIPNGVQVAEYDKDGKLLNEGKLSGDFLQNAKYAGTAIKTTNFVKNTELILTQYSGLRGWGLIFFKDFQTEWNARVDKFFTDSVILGGIETWTSAICQNKYDKSTEGIAYGGVPGGAVVPQAHVEGEKSTSIPYEDPETKRIAGYQRFYKLTFYVRATYQDVEFNVFLDGKQLYPSNIRLKGNDDGKGDEFSATGALAIVRYSQNDYNKICIKFSAGPMTDICNNIAESNGGVTNYEESGGPSQAGRAVGAPQGDAYKDSQGQKPVTF